MLIISCSSEPILLKVKDILNALLVEGMTAVIDIDIYTEDFLDVEGALGLTHDAGSHIEVALLRDQENILLTLAHELVHVFQIISGVELNEETAYGLEQSLYEVYFADISDSDIQKLC